MFTCVADISTWASERYLRLNRSNTNSWFAFHKSSTWAVSFFSGNVSSILCMGHKLWAYPWLLLLLALFKVHSESNTAQCDSTTLEATVISLLNYCKSILTGPPLPTLPTSICHITVSVILWKGRSGLSLLCLKPPLASHLTQNKNHSLENGWHHLVTTPHLGSLILSLTPVSFPPSPQLLWPPYSSTKTQDAFVTKPSWLLFPVQGIIFFKIYAGLLLSFPSISIQMFLKERPSLDGLHPTLALSVPLI